MNHTKAPFTREQVISLNNYQSSGVFHEYTCPNWSDLTFHVPAAGLGVAQRELDGILVAKKEGLVCKVCNYRQDWVHTWTADNSWTLIDGV